MTVIGIYDMGLPEVKRSGLYIFARSPNHLQLQDQVAEVVVAMESCRPGSRPGRKIEAGSTRTTKSMPPDE